MNQPLNEDWDDLILVRVEISLKELRGRLNIALDCAVVLK